MSRSVITTSEPESRMKSRQTATWVITAEIVKGHFVESSLTRPRVDGVYAKADTLKDKQLK